MKKFFLTTASLLTMVSLMGVAQAGVAAAKPSKPTHASAHVGQVLSEAKARSMIRTGQLKPATARQAAKLNALVKNANTTARMSTQGNTEIGHYQEQGRLWYDYRYTYGYSSSNYWYYYLYKNWQVCSSGYAGTASSGWCYSAYSYDYYYYVYYYGTYYIGGWYGPYPG